MGDDAAKRNKIGAKTGTDVISVLCFDAQIFKKCKGGQEEKGVDIALTKEMLTGWFFSK